MPIGLVPLLPVAVMGGYAVVAIGTYLIQRWRMRKQIKEFRQEVDQWVKNS